jgi:hypothetical protein
MYLLNFQGLIWDNFTDYPHLPFLFLFPRSLGSSNPHKLDVFLFSPPVRLSLRVLTHRLFIPVVEDDAQINRPIHDFRAT